MVTRYTGGAPHALDVTIASGRAELPCVFHSTDASLASTERVGLCWHADSN